MTKKVQPDQSPDTRRRKVESDVEEFLNSGAKIVHIPNGVTAYDGQGRTNSALATNNKRPPTPPSQVGAQTPTQAPTQTPKAD